MSPLPPYIHSYYLQCMRNHKIKWENGVFIVERVENIFHDSVIADALRRRSYFRCDDYWAELKSVFLGSVGALLRAERLFEPRRFPKKFHLAGEKTAYLLIVAKSGKLIFSYSIAQREGFSRPKDGSSRAVMQAWYSVSAVCPASSHHISGMHSLIELINVTQTRRALSTRQLSASNDFLTQLARHFMLRDQWDHPCRE